MTDLADTLAAIDARSVPIQLISGAVMVLGSLAISLISPTVGWWTVGISGAVFLLPVAASIVIAVQIFRERRRRRFDARGSQ